MACTRAPSTSPRLCRRPQYNLVDLRELRGGKLDVVPEGLGVPTAEVVELRKDIHFALLGDFRIHQRNAPIVVLVVELAAQLEAHGVSRKSGQDLDHGIRLCWQRQSERGSGVARLQISVKGLPTPGRTGLTWQSSRSPEADGLCRPPAKPGGQTRSPAVLCFGT